MLARHTRPHHLGTHSSLQRLGKVWPHWQILKGVHVSFSKDGKRHQDQERMASIVWDLTTVFIHSCHHLDVAASASNSSIFKWEMISIWTSNPTSWKWAVAMETFIILEQTNKTCVQAYVLAADWWVPVGQKRGGFWGKCVWMGRIPLAVDQQVLVGQKRGSHWGKCA